MNQSQENVAYSAELQQRRIYLSGEKVDTLGEPTHAVRLSFDPGSSVILQK